MRVAAKLREVPSMVRMAVFSATAIVVLLAIPLLVGPYQTLLLSYGLIIAIAALGFNLLLGYSGLLSFGHSAYFGAGAYSAALMSKYVGTSSMEVFIAGGLIVTITISALFGLVCIRHKRIFFAILTLALSQVLWSLAYKFYWATNGSDGINISFPSLLGGLLTYSGSGAYQRFIYHYYYYILFFFVISTAVMWIVVHSPIGKALQSIRDNETRAVFIGLPVRLYRWIAFVISGSFTGLAGVLWLPLNRHVTPEILHWPFSGEIVFLTVLGGYKSFMGPIVGAISFNYLKTYAIALTEYWQMVLGIVLVVLVLALPSGIVGAFRLLSSRLKIGWRS